MKILTLLLTIFLYPTDLKTAYPVELRPVNHVNEYFTGDWETDNARILKLIAYVHHGDRKDRSIEENCGSYRHIGIYQKTLAPTQIGIVQSIQSLHQTSGPVCTMNMTDAGISFSNGDIFLQAKTVKKLNNSAFFMLIAHEVSHQLSRRMFVNYTPKQEEHFADAIALWSAICLQQDIPTAINFLESIPGNRNGGSTHPSSVERKQYLAKLASCWLTTKGQFHESLTPHLSTLSNNARPNSGSQVQDGSRNR